jgi:hypothetical protein
MVIGVLTRKYTQARKFDQSRRGCAPCARRQSRGLAECREYPGPGTSGRPDAAQASKHEKFQTLPTR